MADLGQVKVGETVQDPALLQLIEGEGPQIGDVVSELPPSAPAPQAEPAAQTPDAQPAPESTPLPLPERVEPDILQPPLGLERSGLMVKAANAGVAFDKPAPGGHATASFALDGKNREQAYKMALREHYGRDIPMRVGPETERLEYLNPDTERWSLVTSAEGTFGEAAALAGPAMVLAPELLFGGATAVVTRSPALVALGGAGGALMGELARLYAGQAMGINTDVSDEQIAKEAAKAAGISLASAGVATAAFKTAGFLGRAIRGEQIPKDVRDALELSDFDAQRVQEQINERVPGFKLQFTLAQSTGDEMLLSWQEAVRLSPEYHREFGPFLDAQQDALRAFLTNVSRPFRTRQTLEETAEGVRRTAQAQATRDLDRQQVFIDMTKAELSRMRAEVKSSVWEEAGPLIRQVGDAEQQSFRDWARGRAAELNELAGDAAFLPNRATAQAVADLSQEARNVLIPSLRDRISRFIGAADPEAAEGATQAVESVAARLFDPNAKFTFAELWETTSALKELVRASSTGAATDAPSTGVMKKLIGAMQNDMDAGMEGSALRGLYDNFRRHYALEKRRLDEGVVGQIMRRAGGAQSRFVVNDEAVFRQFFRPKNREAADDLFNLVRDDPQAFDGVRSAINDFYKRQVTTESGRVNPALHDKFMEDHGEALGVFFSKREVATIQKIGGVEKALRAREAKLESMTKQARETFEFKVGSISRPGQLLATVMDRNSPADARALMEIIGADATLSRSVKAQAASEVRERVMGQYLSGTRERVVSPSKLDTLLNGKSGEKGHRDVLRAVFGERYIEDLDLLNRAVQIAAKESRVTNRSNTSAGNKVMKGLTRAAFGPLSRTGFRITQMMGIQSVGAQRVIAKALLNPKSLRDLVEAREMDITTDKAVALLSSMGGTAMFQDFEPVPRGPGVPSTQSTQ